MQKKEQISVNGLVREFLIYVPDDAFQIPDLPLIISLHGTLGSSEQMISFADFRPLADKERFIIVCPDGIEQTWNDGRATKANQKGVDDVKFIDQLITYMINTYAVNYKRIYITGMSNGGFMASRLACELPHRIAAIAAVAASMDKTALPPPIKPLPVMYIHGTKDRIVPYAGGATKTVGGNVYSHEDILKVWVHVNHCNPDPAITAIPDVAHDDTTVVKGVYRSSVGADVVAYTIINGGHTWPSGPQYASKYFVGLVTYNLDGCRVIWDFFKNYQLKH